MNKNNAFFIAALAFLALLLVVFSEFVFDSSKLTLNNDQLGGVGTRYVRAQNLILPQWDDSRLGGVPTIDALFADVYHPLAIVYFILDPDRATGFKFILTIWCAFLAAYILARYLTDKWQCAALLGFLYACSPQYFTYIYGGHDGKMIVFAAAPFAMYALMRLLREGSIKHGIYFSLSIVWMVLSPHLQLTYFFLWGAALYTLFEMFSNKLSAKVRCIRMGLAVLALSIGLAISAFQIIPPYIYTTTDSIRGSAEKTTIEHSASWSLHGEELAAMILPGFLGTDTGKGQNTYWGQNHFKLNADGAGALLTFLALCGCLLPGSRKQALFWFAGCAIALSYAVGLHSFLFSVWYNIIPGVKNFRAPSMAIFWIPLAFLFLAAPVLKNFEENKEVIKKGAILYGILLVGILFFRYAWESLNGVPVAIFIVLFGAYFIRDFQDKFRIALWALPFLLIASFFLNPVENSYFKPVDFIKANNLVSYSFTSFILCAAAVAAVFSKKPLVMLAVAAMELAVVNLPYVQTVPRAAYYSPKHAVVQAIKQDSPNDNERPRIFSLTRNPAFTTNNLASYGFRNALGFHDNEIATYRIFKESLQNPAMLDLMNVGYILYDGERGMGIEKNQGDLGRAKMYYKWESEKDIINRLKDREFDYRNILLLENSKDGEYDGQGSVKIIYAKMDKLKFEVESSAAGKLFISENFHKYWKAEVNGENAEISRAFSTFMSVDVPQGKSVVQLQYKSESVRMSLIIGVCGLIVLLFAVAISCISKKFFFESARKIRDKNKWIRNNFLWRLLMPYWNAFKYKVYLRPQSREFFKTNENRINSVADLLADSESKKTYLAIIDFRCTGNKKNVPYHGEENQYFINDFFKYGKEEVLIDCGAYTGDTVESFLKLPDMEYKKIISFEPDAENYKILSKKFEANSKIEIINAGVFDRDGKISFSETGDSISCIQENGKSSINIRSIDSVCSKDAATLIKMDIEGAELPALKGAKETILRCKPKLAICIYHSDQDMLSIAEYIHSIVPEYKLYVRQHHRDYFMETVLYAQL